MNLFADKDIKRFFVCMTLTFLALAACIEGWYWLSFHTLSPALAIVILLAMVAVWATALGYFCRQARLMEAAVAQINEYLAGNTSARIESDEEGALHQLFHAINALAAVLNAHADREEREKAFLKRTISDISHQLKTPLTALNIYNSLLADEAAASPTMQEFTALSEQELDRIETLVQNLLKIARLDAGAIAFDRHEENVAEMLSDIAQRYAFRAEQEEKNVVLKGSDAASLVCDRQWLREAVGNIVKNALDHTKPGDTITISWQALPTVVQIVVKDTGLGIHPEDLPHVFKRFYRSRFAKESPGIGLGLPLAKTIIEAHDGTIELESVQGQGTVFTMNFTIPTKL